MDLKTPMFLSREIWRNRDRCPEVVVCFPEVSSLRVDEQSLLMYLPTTLSHPSESIGRIAGNVCKARARCSNLPGGPGKGPVIPNLS